MNNLMPQSTPRKARVFRALSIGAAALAGAVIVVGCASEHASGTGPKEPNEPLASPTPQQNGSIVIVGTPDDRTEPPARRANDAEIAALVSRATASQGKDNGQPVTSSAPLRTAADVRNELEQNRAQIAEQEAARKKLFEDQKVAALPNPPQMPDPAAVAVIDKTLGDLKAQKATLDAELATLTAREERAR